MSLTVPCHSRILSLGPSVGQGAGHGWAGVLAAPHRLREYTWHRAMTARPMKLTSPRTCLNSSSSPWQCGASLAQPPPPTLCLIRGVPIVVAILPPTTTPYPPRTPGSSRGHPETHAGGAQLRSRASRWSAARLQSLPRQAHESQVELSNLLNYPAVIKRPPWKAPEAPGRAGGPKLGAGPLGHIEDFASPLAHIRKLRAK